MRRPATVLAAFAALAFALAPALADARPGGGSSMGSRGSRTYSAPPSTSTAPGYTRPMERTAEQPRSAAPYGQAAQVRPPFGQPAGGMFRGGFMAGLMGGLIGAGIGGLLFGHGLFGGFSGFASFLGLLLQIALIVLVVRFAIGWFRNRQTAAASGPAYAGVPTGGVPNGMAREALDNRHGPRPAYGGGSPGGAAAGQPITLTREDLASFETTLRTVNAAWSRQDEQGMRAVATAEMVKYFGDDLADLARRGLRNETSDLKLEQGDLAESWREGNRDYATVAMRFSMIDVTRRIDNGAIVEGDPVRRTQATELWTFIRTPGGPWLLSAIQQTA